MQKVLRRRQALQGLVNDWQGRGRVFEIVEIMNHCKLSGRPVVVTWSQRDSLCYCKKLSQGTCGTQLLNVVSEGALCSFGNVSVICVDSQISVVSHNSRQADDYITSCIGSFSHSFY